MRISDWSSDVCSSDLEEFRLDRTDCDVAAVGGFIGVVKGGAAVDEVGAAPAAPGPHLGEGILHGQQMVDAVDDRAVDDLPFPARPRACQGRSEEHTSELQSLMRISYAVFCLKKKTNNPLCTQNHTKQTR